VTKTDRIRELLAEGEYTSSEIAVLLETSVRRVCVVRWRDKHPGYQARWRAEIRRRKRAEQEGATA